MSLDGYSNNNWMSLLQSVNPLVYPSLSQTDTTSGMTDTSLFGSQSYNGLSNLQNQTSLFTNSPVSCDVGTIDFSQNNTFPTMGYPMLNFDFSAQLSLFTLMMQSLSLQLSNLMAQSRETLANLSLSSPSVDSSHGKSSVSRSSARAGTSTRAGTSISQTSLLSRNTLAGYGNYNFDVTKKYKGTASDLNRHLRGALKGKGAVLIRLQNKYGINAAFMAALANTESAHGTSNAARTKNNVTGTMTKESGYKKLKTYKSIDDSLEAMAKNIKNNYVNNGKKTITQIHQKYCPIGAANDPTGMNKNWGATISQLTNQYEREVA